MRSIWILGFTAAMFLLSFAQIQTETNWQLAIEQIKALKKGALVVCLKSNDKSISAYRANGNNELADKLEVDAKVQNLAIAHAFKYSFDFCKVYFTYAKNEDDVLAGKQGIFLDKDLKIDTSIHLNQGYFLFVEYGAVTSNMRKDEYHYNGVYSTEPTSTPTTGTALVVLDTTLTQLREPFPFYTVVYTNNFTSGVAHLNQNLEKFYLRVITHEQENNIKKKK